MTITDQFARIASGISGPLIGGFAVTPADGSDLAAMTRALMVGVAGDVAVVTQDGSAITLTGLVAGVVYPIRVSRVKSTGTTATSIVGLY